MAKVPDIKLTVDLSELKVLVELVKNLEARVKALEARPRQEPRIGDVPTIWPGPYVVWSGDILGSVGSGSTFVRP